MNLGFVRFLISSILLSSSFLAFAGDLCGSKAGYFNQLATSYLIPDYFPPENALSELLSSPDLDRCLAIGQPFLGSACAAHDRCYEEQQGKVLCDKNLQDDWVRACRATYDKLSRDHLICRFSCELFVKILSEAQRFEQDDFCPSCTAYDSAGFGPR